VNFLVPECGHRVKNWWSSDIVHLYPSSIFWYLWSLWFVEEIKVDDTKEVIRCRKSKKNRQHNDQKIKDKKDKQWSIKHRILNVGHIHTFYNVRARMLNSTFNNIQAWSCRLVLLVEETGMSGENHRPAGSHWQTLSQSVVSSTPRHEQGSNSQH
jgi:hypothetical protein